MQATYENIHLIRNADGEPFGIALGVCKDYVDHSVGHKALADSLGVGRAGEVGIDQYRTSIGRNPLKRQMWVTNLNARRGDWKDLPAETRLVVATPGSWELDEYKADDLKSYFYLEDFATGQVPPLRTAWSSNGFLIRAFGKEERAFIKRLAKAFENNDVVLGDSETMRFGDGPLVIAIATSVPEEIKAAHLDPTAAIVAEDEPERAPSFGF
jgi:hypothetical protein